MPPRINPLLVLVGLGALGLAGSASDEPTQPSGGGGGLAPEPSPTPPPPSTGPGELVIVDGRATADVTKRWENRPFDPVGVTLHQMGVSRSAEPDKLRKTAAHFVVMRDGRVLWLHPLDKRVKSTSYRNSIQVEVEGNFQSTRGKWWRGSSGTLPIHTLNPQQAIATRKLLEVLEPWLTPNSRGKYLLSAHRMGASLERRGNDPGPEVWTAAAPWALSGNWELDRLIGEGTMPPDEWYSYTPVAPLANA